MTIGFDYFGTVTKHPEIFSAFSKILAASGHRLIVISAISQRDQGQIISYRDSVAKYLSDHEIQCDEIFIVPFINSVEVPGLKLRVATQEQVEYFFDDRTDVVKMLEENGIPTCRIK